jgi:exo-beta-1,3-glucanase (GH17 family)
VNVRLYFLSLLAICTAVAASPATVAQGQPFCNRNPAATPAITRLRAAMAQGRFIAYEPTSLRVINGHSTQADAVSIRADLTVLRPLFDSLITYESLHGAEQIPSIAASLGFRAIIIGVWNPFDRAELDTALSVARQNPGIVVGLSLGNEMVLSGRRKFAELADLLKAVRATSPQLALSTTEPFHLFYEPAASAALSQMDFLLANVHPVFQPWFKSADPAALARFVVNVVSKLSETYCGPILVKETGIPTAPAASGFTSERQASFYNELHSQFPRSSNRAFAYFAAFDAPWRAYDANPVGGAAASEAYWGLFDEARHPKLVVSDIPRQ